MKVILRCESCRTEFVIPIEASFQRKYCTKCLRRINHELKHAPGIRRRGFASMPKDRLLELTRKGGRNSAAGKKGHRWTKETASLASKKAKRADLRGKAMRTIKRLLNPDEED